MPTNDIVMPRRARQDAGFTLPEVLIAMGIMLVVLAGTFSAMTNAMDSERAARNLTTMNGNLRAGMDLVTRDLIQVGQGLPIGRIVGIPNGAGATAIARPGPAASGACPGVGNFTAGPSIPAVTVGPGRGPAINGVCTDVITTLAVDSAFEGANVSSISAASTLTVYQPGADDILNTADDVRITDAPDVNGDNVRVGDLLLITKGDLSVLIAVTAVSGQTITFANGGALGINQTAAAQGTVNQLRLNTSPAADPVAPTFTGGLMNRGPSSISRVRMITYFVNTTADPASPRLMRQIGAGAAMAVAFDLEAFNLTYDIADGDTNPANVDMTAADLAVGGACGTDPCSPSQIRKVNVTMAIRSRQEVAGAGFSRNTLASRSHFAAWRSSIATDRRSLL
jgi:prepilin-type N-terminal cleavage/methylation domain-containing protein